MDLDTQPEIKTPEPEPTAETPAAKRERATYPVRLMRRTEAGTYEAPLGGLTFDKIDAAERWIRESGEPGTVYLLARVIGARRMPLRAIEEVPL